jgi:hypothetical protein
MAAAATQYVRQYRCLKNEDGYARLVSESDTASPDMR